jgi:hypothetical protein
VIILRQQYIQRPSPYRIGHDQELLIKKIIVDVATSSIGECDNAHNSNPHIRETMVWRNDHGTRTVNWYRPNTHPQKVGEVHVPDFDFWANDRRLANLESKNWEPKWLFSLSQAEEKIFSRVTGRPVELGNVLIISKLICQQGDEQRILELLQQHRFKVLLTSRKTESPNDQAMYGIIRAKLEPILAYIFTLQGPKPDWTLLLINVKPALQTIVVLSMTHLHYYCITLTQSALLRLTVLVLCITGLGLLWYGSDRPCEVRQEVCC